MCRLARYQLHERNGWLNRQLNRQLHREALGTYHSNHLRADWKIRIEMGIDDEEKEPQHNGTPNGEMGEDRPCRMLKTRFQTDRHHHALQRKDARWVKRKPYP